MTSAAEKLQRRLGGNVVPLASVEVERGSERQPIQVPGDVVEAVELEARGRVREDGERRIEGVLDTLDCRLDQYGEFRIKAMIGQRSEWVPLASEVGVDTIRAVLEVAGGRAPPKTLIEQVQAKARMRGREKPVMHTYQRVGRDGSDYLIDLGDQEGRAIRVREGTWEVERKMGTAFVRPRGCAPLPEPARPASTREALVLLAEFVATLGIPKTRIPLVVVALVCWLREGVTYPVLSLHGVAGSGKSTAALLLLSLVDPPASRALPTVAQEAEHVAAAAQVRHVLTIDNASKFLPKFQDTLCVCATGGELVGRRLYTNGEASVLPIHRPVMVTSIGPVITRPDLLSRSIPVELPPRTDRQDMDALRNSFDAQAGYLFGALVELVAASTVKVEREDGGGHRLHDFVLAGQRIWAQVGKDPANFLGLVNRMRASAGAEIAAGDTFLVALRTVLEELAKGGTTGASVPNWKAWFPSGKVAVRGAGRVCVAIRPQALVDMIRQYPHGGATEGWLPRNTRELGSALVRSTPLLADLGTVAVKREPSAGHSYWEFSFANGEEAV